MPFAKSIKITLLAVAGFVAVAALTLLLRQRRSVGGGMSHATAYDFGEVVQGQPVEHEFAWRNTERDRKMLRLPLGCGLHFLDLSPADLDRVATFVDDHRQD